MFFYFSLFAICILDPSMDAEKDIPMKDTMKMNSHVLYLVFQDKPILTSYMSIRFNQVTLRDFNSGSFFVKSVWVLWRFIHPKPLRKTRFYDNRTRKSVISRNCLSFWSLNLICILNVDIAHLFGFIHFLPIIDS